MISHVKLRSIKTYCIIFIRNDLRQMTSPTDIAGCERARQPCPPERHGATIAVAYAVCVSISRRPDKTGQERRARRILPYSFTLGHIALPQQGNSALLS